MIPSVGLDQADVELVAPAGISVRVHRLAQIPSAALDLETLVAALNVAHQQIQGGARAAVLTMGTDLLEEAAFALDLLWDRPQPLVVTAAMRPPTVAGSDGPANLRAALLVADSPQAAGLGCVVVLNDEIHAAWSVRKAHTSSTAAFRSSASGALGEITEDTVRITNRPMHRPRLVLDGTTPVPPVALLTGCMADDGRLLTAVPGLGYQGLVVQAAGGGSVPPAWSAALRSVAKQIPVVYASRAGSGAVLQRTYGGPGSERDLMALGVQPAGMLDAVRARILLQLLLATGASNARHRECFAAFDTPMFQHRSREVAAPRPPAGQASTHSFSAATGYAGRGAPTPGCD